ncbi:hypothetical protein G6F68_012086 [Rhizopus microsporus]|nr:hypothetical protein G6F68_012086 [Rhizopus microsporus]
MVAFGIVAATVFGIPIGVLISDAFGWRAAFWIMSGLTLVLIAWVLAKVPDYPGQSAHERMPLRRVFTTPGVRRVLAVVIAWMLAHNILYTYIAPFVAPAGLGARVDLVLFIFGASALVGIWITGKLVDRHLRSTVLASLAAFGATALAFGLVPANPAVIYVGIAVWGISFGGAATLLQTALADAAGRGADVALSMNVAFSRGPW